MIKLIGVCCALLVSEFSYGTSIKGYEQLKQIGTVSPDGQSVTITADQFNKYAESHTGESLELPRKIADMLIDKGLDAALECTGIEGEIAKFMLKNVLPEGVKFEAKVSLDEYNKAFEEGGPLAAALTDPMGDGCNIL